MIRHQPEQERPGQLGSIDRHLCSTRGHVVDLAVILNGLLPHIIQVVNGQQRSIDQQTELFERVTASLDRIERAIADLATEQSQ